MYKQMSSGLLNVTYKLFVYEDDSLVYKLTLFIKFHPLRKILHMFKLG